MDRLDEGLQVLHIPWDAWLKFRDEGQGWAPLPAVAGEAAHVHADERALFCPGQLFLTALHGSIYFASSPGRRIARRAGQGGRALAYHESRLSAPYLTLHWSRTLNDRAFRQGVGVVSQW